MESVSLIDVSSEDDFLIATNDNPSDPRPSGNHELRKVSFFLESIKNLEGENPVKMSKQLEQSPELSESPELKRARSGKINLRKSLAWDSAFFTSEGVLDTEELAIVNSTFRRAEGCKLPEIQEDLRKSSESTSTLDSENYALDNLEVDLFDNLRASIQMSIGKRDKASSSVTDAAHLGSVKKVDLPHKMKPTVNMKRDVVSKQQLHYTSKEAITGVKAAAKGSAQSNSLSRPPRVEPKPMSMVPSFKSSSGSIQLKDNTRKASSGGVIRPSVVVSDKTNGNSSSVTARTNSSVKPAPGSQSGTVVFLKTSSSYSSPVSSSSDSAGKSPLEPSRKRSALRNSDHSLSGSTTKTPSRTPKSRHGPSNAIHPPICANSTFRFSSKISPHSSIDSVLSESSSSASNTIKPSNSVESLGASSTCSSCSLAVASDVDFSHASYSDMHLFTIGQSCVRKETSGSLSQNQNIARASNGTRASNNVGSRCSKPSGLRMPSPKIGYFDAEKTIVHSSNKLSQTSLRSSLVKSTTETSNIIAGPNKLKSTKIPSVRPAAQPVAMNFANSTKESPPNQQNHLTRPASPISICQHSESAQLHWDLPSHTSKDNHNVVFTSAEVAEMVHPASAATIQTDGQGRMENIHLVSNTSEKENLSPVSETNGATQELTSEGKNISMVEIMGKKICSLSLSETSNIVYGD
ncbi:putative serine/threonine-protein kinase dyrk2 isoform X1 [Iris pallida]|uniref:Serine/threonine-protein kinase dyrk2 isoform X1 n=1 Tax=Iris pallida TaxID=29817 RepID=A0AAX6HLQ1_IRIPA|nr:putative serine/threonine-protein kinase dyrk2 isoform X1 [Iris pallida]